MSGYGIGIGALLFFSTFLLAGVLQNPSAIPLAFLGIVLIVVGVILFIVGMNASHSMADQISDTFTGRFTEGTTWYIIGGIAVGVLGLLLVLFGGGRKGS